MMQLPARATFIVIGVLGIKLTASLYTHFYPTNAVSKLLTGEKADIATSIFTVGIFIIPVCTSILFNFPKRHTIEPEVAESAERVLDES